MQLSNVVSRTKRVCACACDSTAITRGKSCSIEIYNTYIKMFTVWICIECLHRILKSQLLWTKRWVGVFSRNWRKCQKNLVKNNVWTRNVFKPWLCDGRVLFLHSFSNQRIENIFSPNGDVHFFSFFIPRFQCCLFFFPVVLFQCFFLLAG